MVTFSWFLDLIEPIEGERTKVGLAKLMDGRSSEQAQFKVC